MEIKNLFAAFLLLLPAVSSIRAHVKITTYQVTSRNE